MWRTAAALARVEGLVRQSLAEHYTHCTCVWIMGQVPSQDAVPSVRLMEISVRQRRGNEVLVVAQSS